MIQRVISAHFSSALPILVLLAGNVTSPQVSAQALPSLAPVIERVSPAVVNISVVSRIDNAANPLSSDPFFRRFFDDLPDQREFRSAGSGVIVDAGGGLILTNHHVIEQASEITVTLLDNRTAEARVMGSDAASDIAVLEIDADRLTGMEFGDSDALRVGDFVVAIGNPFGFSNTVTSGIVSGLGRSGVSGNANAYEDFIQTDASINPGNSGGALVDLSGNLIGINSAIISRGGGNVGIGFAIPVNMVRNVMDQLVEFGEVRRGLLGVTIRSLSPEIASLYELESVAGAIVTDVSPGSAAASAGIEVEDVIVSIDENAVADSASLRNIIGLMQPGDSVSVGIVRRGEMQTLTAVLGALTPRGNMAAASPREEQDESDILVGVELAVTEIEDGSSGLLVVRVADGSPAAMNGLRRGDVVVEINRQRVATLEDARAATGDAEALVLQVRRENRDLVILIQ